MNGRGANIVIFANFGHILHPPIGLFCELQQHTISQKTTFLMKIYDFANENIVFSEKFGKSQIYSFDWFHIGMLCTKSLTVNRHPLELSDFKNFFTQVIFLPKRMRIHLVP